MAMLIDYISKTKGNKEPFYPHNVTAQVSCWKCHSVYYIKVGVNPSEYYCPWCGA
jgi:hypothetical protein